MSEERVDDDLKHAIIAYFEGWELVDYLEVPIETVVELLEEYIIDNIEDISEIVGMGEDTDDEPD